jgi:hypothetical protein
MSKQRTTSYDDWYNDPDRDLDTHCSGWDCDHCNPPLSAKESDILLISLKSLNKERFDRDLHNSEKITNPVYSSYYS